jgi:hypothetical protein
VAQQTEHIQARFVGEGSKSGDCVQLLHFSNIVEIWRRSNGFESTLGGALDHPRRNRRLPDAPMPSWPILCEISRACVSIVHVRGDAVYGQHSACKARLVCARDTRSMRPRKFRKPDTCITSRLSDVKSLEHLSTSANEPSRCYRHRRTHDGIELFARGADEHWPLRHVR